MKLKITYLIFVLLLLVANITFMIIFIERGDASASAIFGLWTGAFLFKVLPNAIKFIVY
jgi:hypothetical protein